MFWGKGGFKHPATRRIGLAAIKNHFFFGFWALLWVVGVSSSIIANNLHFDLMQLGGEPMKRPEVLSMKRDLTYVHRKDFNLTLPDVFFEAGLDTAKEIIGVDGVLSHRFMQRAEGEIYDQFYHYDAFRKKLRNFTYTLGSAYITSKVNYSKYDDLVPVGHCVLDDSPLKTEPCGELFRQYVRDRLKDDSLDTTYFFYQFHTAQYDRAKKIYERALEANKKLNEVDRINKSISYAFIWISGFWVVLIIWFLIGHKYALFPRPRWFPQKFWLGGVGFFGLFIYTVLSNDLLFFYFVWRSWLAFVTPVLIWTLPTYIRLAWEYWTETPLYTRLRLGSHNQGSGGFGGMREFFKTDCTDLVNTTTPAGAPKENESTFYLGKTGWEHDIRLGGRHIGIKGHNHKLVVAPTGSGKSLNCLTSALTMWQGGGLIFDIKGEHWDTVIKHKSAPKYLFDPFHERGGDKRGWNPLLEIPADSPTARADIRRMCSALFVRAKGDTGLHFRETGMKLLRGIIAHVISTYPPELRHLGTVYDLFNQGYPDGQEPPKQPVFEMVMEEGRKVKKPLTHPDGSPVMVEMSPEDCFDAFIQDMLKNEACGKSPKDGATAYLRTLKGERSGLLSTISRAIDWINDDNMRKLLTATESFSLDVIKKEEAWVVVAVPEKYLEETMLFIRLFYQRALDMVDNFTTKNAPDHKRRMLFLLEEFDKFGFEFGPAIDLVNFKRSSRVMGVFVLQNMGQLEHRYENVNNFLSGCDSIFLDIPDDDEKTAQMVSDAIGKKSEDVPSSDGGFKTTTIPVMSPDDVRLSFEAGFMIVLPKGKKMKKLYLRAMDCHKVFPWTHHDKLEDITPQESQA